MNKKTIIPLVMFATVFLIYSIYFVKVVNQQRRLEDDSIAKSVIRVMSHQERTTEMKEQQEQMKNQIKQQKVTTPPESVTSDPKKLPTVANEELVRYVNYTWLNVRSEPTLASPVVSRLDRNDRVFVTELTTASWAKIRSEDGTEGFVARRYLSTRPLEVETAKVPEVAESVSTVPVSAPVSQDPVVGVPELYTIPIISYHHITDKVGIYAQNLVLPERNFIAQLDWLVANGFETLTFADLKLIKEGKKSMTDKQVILTFDDGYDDAYLAAQHLNGKGLKGVFFVISDSVGSTGYLDWRQVKKMTEWGMEIGSHGKSSANLLTAGAFGLQQELEESKKTIEAQIGKPVISYAYPDGGYTEAVMVEVQEAGYSFARSTRSGSQYIQREFYQLPMLRVFPTAGAKQFSAWLGN
jgi:peptidoglycan/xylan/chitin deacetylase (PgdA/CDA1 family)